MQQSGLWPVSLVAILFASGVSGQCTGFHQWRDGTNCYACSTTGCPIGMFRETCTAASTQDAHCIPCSMPPPNAEHVTGGLPYMEDRCMWACNEGYYRDGESCKACGTESCPIPGMVRRICLRGSIRDAECQCPMDTFLAEPLEVTVDVELEGELLTPSPAPSDEPKETSTCRACRVTMCNDPDNEVLLRCPGTTTEDISICIPNVANTVVTPDGSGVRRVAIAGETVEGDKDGASSSEGDNSTIIDVDTTQQPGL